MKRLICLTAVITAMVFGVGLANAAVWTDIVQDHVLLNSGNRTHLYYHDITDGPDGFVPGSDTVSSYQLKINLQDDRDQSYESAFIFAPFPFGTSYNFNINVNEIGANIGGLIELNVLGRLDIALIRTSGDFYFGRSGLVATGTAVPEPGTLLLLGSGLVGLVGFGRKKLKK